MKKDTRKKAFSPWFFWVTLVLLSSACEQEESPVLAINFLGGTINNAILMDGMEGVEPEVTIRLTFSAALAPASFRQKIELEQTSNGSRVSFSLQYAAGSSRADVTAILQRNTTYRLKLQEGVIGANGEQLDRSRQWQFSTIGEEVITEQAPCVNASPGCLESIPISGTFTNDVYSSFPLLAANRRWEKLTHAVIAVHGQNRNADDYFRFLTHALQQEGLSESTILIAPEFSDQGGGNSLYWSDRGWRFGENSDGGSSISSFSVVDALIEFLGNSEVFPVLETILITGHSSGAAFTHLYAVANDQEEKYPDHTFQYLAANSQYFYYPEDVRWNAVTKSFEAVDVNACPDFNFWPYGFSRLPDYLAGADRTAINHRFAKRSVTYLLGTDDVVTTGSLNTRDCGALLLGEHRYARGQLMHQLIETYYTASEQHERLDVPDVGHNAEEMYASTVFLQRLSDIFH